MTGRHRHRSLIMTTVVWIIRTAVVVFLIIAALLIYVEMNS